MDSLQPIRPFRMGFPSEIIPRILYLGDVRSCRDRDALKAVGITHIVNVTKDLNDEFREDFQYYRIPMWDDFRKDIKKHFKDAFSFIDRALKDNGTVFIHCQAGISRSSTFVIGYLMHVGFGNLCKSYDYVKSLRPQICPNVGFMTSLTEYELQRFGKPSVTLRFSQYDYNLILSAEDKLTHVEDSVVK